MFRAREIKRLVYPNSTAGVALRRRSLMVFHSTWDFSCSMELMARSRHGLEDGLIGRRGIVMRRDYDCMTRPVQPALPKSDAEYLPQSLLIGMITVRA